MTCLKRWLKKIAFLTQISNKDCSKTLNDGSLLGELMTLEGSFNDSPRDLFFLMLQSVAVATAAMSRTHSQHRQQVAGCVDMVV